MTKGELIKLLEQYPDDMIIIVMDDMEGVEAGTPSSIRTENNEIIIHTEWR